MRHTKRRNQAVLASGLSLVIIALQSGCATVKPQPDYARAQELIKESTGAADAFDPEQDELSTERIDACLADGLTLDEALRLALLNNRQLQAAFYDIGISRADWVQAGLLSNPSLGIGVMFPEGGGRSNIQGNLAQNIVDLWQMPVEKRIAERDVERQVVRVARLAGELAVETKRAYYHAVAAVELLDIAAQSVELYQKSYEATRVLRESGTGTQLDENLQRGELLQAQLNLRRAELIAKNARRALGRLLSVDGDLADVTFADGLPTASPPSIEAEVLITLAREHRLDLRALHEAVLAGGAEIQLEYLKVFPEVSVGIGAERPEGRSLPGRDIPADFARSSLRAGKLTVPDIQTRGERAAAKDQDIEFMIGPNLAVTLPIFDQNQAQIARARYAHLQAVKSYEDLYINIAQDIRIATDRAQTLWINVAFYHDQLLPQAERSLDFTNAAWEAGAVDVLTLLASQRNLLDARREYATAHAAAAASLSDLERAVGLPLDRILEAEQGDDMIEHANEDGGASWAQTSRSVME